MPVIPTHTLDSVTEGDSWVGIPILGPVTITDDNNPEAPPTDPAYPLARARIHFVRADTGVTGARFGNSAADQLPIVVNDEPTWNVTVPPVPFRLFPLKAGDWIGEYEVTDTEGTRLTLCKFALTVNPQVTT